MTEWFEQWFGEEYLELYPHRDDEDAERAVGLVARTVALDGALVLDLACGPGRHAVHLATHGARVVGYDLSAPLLSRARHSAHMERLVRGDMRVLPFRAGVFDAVVNLFTSFGYFDDDEQHLTVLRGVCQSLRVGGTMVLDFLNATAVRDTLQPHEQRVVGSQRVSIDRRITDDHRYVEKQMHLEHDGRSFLERVRLFSDTELADLMERAGLTVSTLFGDYDGAGYAPDAPRTILVASRR